MTGKFIVFEGIDGAGTETQSNKLLQYLNANGKPAERIEYPDYEGPIGNMIHEFLHKKFELSPLVQMSLYGTDMAKDSDKINAWKDQGKVVIADRYFTSTLAYQTMFGVPREKCLKFAEIMGLVKPDAIIFLKIESETSLVRKRGEKQGNVDRFEENTEIHQKTLESYDSLIRDSVFGPWYVLDGERSKDGVFELVKKVLQL